MTTPPKLDDDQLRVAEAEVRERLYVTAGPGSGKTEAVSGRIAFLLEQEGLSGQEILVISFSRAAVEAVQRRLRQTGSRSWVRVTTLDSLATRILAEDGAEVTGLSFDTRIKRLAKMLANDEITDPLSEVRHVIIDEAQDVVGLRAALVGLLLETLPEDVGFTMLGDPKQGIYDFQLEENFDDPDFLLQTARDLGATEVGLWGQYRADSRDARKAMKLRSGRTDLAWIADMRGFLAEMPSFEADELPHQLAEMEGTVAVLTQSNAQALTLARRLYLQGVDVELLPRSADRSIDPWVAEVMADAPSSITRSQFEELISATDCVDPDEAWYLLRAGTSAKTKFLNIPEAARRLATGGFPVGLTRRRGRITVSTVHRAKGLEFDHVLLLDPLEWYGDEDSDYARVLYVAITRPRRRLFTFRPNPSDRYWKTCSRTDRAYKTNYKGKGTTGFEIRGTDWRGIAPPGDPEYPEYVQNLLRDLAARSAPIPIEVSLNAYESTLSRPQYDAYFDDVWIGTLGEEFTQAFLRRLGKVRNNWPEISEVFFTGVETVAGPPQPGPVGRNGLWLSPLIVGPAQLDWSSNE